MIGGGGTNTFTAYGGINTFFGGSGTNSLSASGGTGTLLGGSGANIYNFTGDGTYTAIGSTGTNTFNASSGTITITGGAGNNSYNFTGAGDYSVTGGAGANALNVVCAISGDSIWLYQYGSTIDVDGTISGQNFYISATNMSSVEAQGSQYGNNELDAYYMTTMGVYLEGYGTGNSLYGGQGPDTLIGGSGSDYLGANNNTDLLYVSGNNSEYIGTGSNTLIYTAPPNVTVTLDGYGLLVSGAYIPFSYVSGIGTVEVEDGSGSDKAYYSGYDALTTIANPYYVGNGQGTQTYTFGYAPYAYNLQFAPDPTGTDFGTGTTRIMLRLNGTGISPPIPPPSAGGGTVTVSFYSNAQNLLWFGGPNHSSWAFQGNPWHPFLNPSTSYPGGYDTYGYWGSWDVTLTVEPGINVSNLTATATSASGAVVTFPQSFTTGGADPSGLSYYEIQNGTQVPVTSGVTSFPIGTTVVYATASDSGSIEQAPFNVTVLPLNVSQDATQIAVTVPPSGSVYGQPATLTATVVNSSPGASPLTGKVTFMDGTTRLGTGTLSTADGVTTATFTTTALATGSHSITAVYDDSYGLTKTSVAVPFNVAQDETTTMVTASPTAAVYGQAVKFTATVAVTSPGAGNPTGKVTFMDGTTTLGTGTLSTVNGIPTATFTTGALAFGSNSITAVYSGDKNDITSTSSAIAFNITQDTTKTTVTASPTATAYGQSVTFTATVAVTGLGAGKPTGKVTFMDGPTTLGTGMLSTSAGVTTATFKTAALAVGSHSITAVYSGDTDDITSTSAVLTFNVAKNVTTAVITAVPTATVYGESVKFKTTVAISGAGSGPPTGTVTFMDGTTTLGTGTLSTSAGVTTATFTTAALAVGSHSITAVYSGDTDDISSTSAVLTFNVAEDTTTTTFTASPAAPALDQPVTLTATVGITSPGPACPPAPSVSTMARPCWVPVWSAPPRASRQPLSRSLTCQSGPIQSRLNTAATPMI